MDLKTALDAFYYSTVLCDLRLMNKQFVDETLTYNSLLYLELIFSMKGKCTASRIANLLQVSKPAITLKINALIRQGLVLKVPDPDDRRQNILTVNEEAVTEIQSLPQAGHEAIARSKKIFPRKRSSNFAEC